MLHAGNGELAPKWALSVYVLIIARAVSVRCIGRSNVEKLVWTFIDGAVVRHPERKCTGNPYVYGQHRCTF